MTATELDFATALGFALRHAAWVLEDDEGLMTPLMVVPDQPLPQIHAAPGDVETLLPILRVQQQAVRATNPWTFLLAEVTVNERDAILAEWTTPTENGQILAFYHRLDDGVGIGPVADLSENADKFKLREDMEDIERGMHLHGETIEAIGDAPRPQA